jgi:hypothetical protein
MRRWSIGFLIGVGFLTAGCSDGESTRPRELTTAQEQEFKSQQDAAREGEAKSREP